MYSENLTGTLSVSDENYQKHIYFKNGFILYADTNVIQERLGEILFKSGKITRQEFWSIHKMIEGKNQKIGKLLVENKVLTEKEVFHGIQLQIKSIVLSLFFISSGQWHFEEKAPEVPDDSKFDVNLANVIYEGAARYIQNINIYINQYFSKSPKVLPMSGKVKEVLPEKLVKFHTSLSKFLNKSNDEIPLELGISEKEYWANILPLYLLGVVDFDTIEIKEEDRQNIEKVVGIYNKIKEEKVNYYEIFGLKSDASSDDIRNSYFEFAKKYHPDRITNAPDPGLNEMANFVFSEINRAYDTLIDSEKRRQYDIDKINKNSNDATGPDKSIERASLLHRKAKTLFNQKNYWEATTLLEEAIRLNPDRGACFLLLGMSQMNIPTMTRAAEKNLTIATELDPWSPEPLVALGLLFLNENMTKRAEGFFRKAISINPENAIAIKRLKEIEKDSSKSIKKSSIFKKK
ncbi:MAG: DnaJ domain-containing protein [Candidatus Aminicenantes bacterium]|nr:DnaJ domain-containing protein [Candidatus Aminicenantes bacterium]